MKIQLTKPKGAPPVLIHLPSKPNPYKEHPENVDPLTSESIPAGQSQ